jgi:hypothetical protein
VIKTFRTALKFKLFQELQTKLLFCQPSAVILELWSKLVGSFGLAIFHVKGEWRGQWANDWLCGLEDHTPGVFGHLASHLLFVPLLTAFIRPVGMKRRKAKNQSFHSLVLTNVVFGPAIVLGLGIQKWTMASRSWQLTRGILIIRKGQVCGQYNKQWPRGMRKELSVGRASRALEVTSGGGGGTLSWGLKGKGYMGSERWEEWFEQRHQSKVHPK